MIFKQYNYAITASYMLFFYSLLMFMTSLMINFMETSLLIFWEITISNSSSIHFPIILDFMGTLFSSVVLFISANVMKFASTYMHSDLFLKRFITLVLLFVLSMNMLIFCPHLMTLLLGWDGLGLVSFILVIYYQNPKSLGAGMITALTNRIGDVTLLLAIGWTMNNNHWSILNMWNNPFSSYIILCILIAAMTKSAQMPFSSWLPAAMAAPTPVSALVHSSTLVTAGVFLIIRFHQFLSHLPQFSTILLLSSALTMFMAGLSALTECDMKKIIALSTLSQLGVMMLSLAMGYPKLAFFHLITHALFKALLFICAGSVIHFHHHGQDLRTIGNLTNQLPFTMTALLVANMSLCAMPFLAGFYSKDLILEIALFKPVNLFIFTLLLLATSFTAAYSIRMMITAIWSNNMSPPTHFTNNQDMNTFIPALLLSLGAISAGAFIAWQILPITHEVFLPSKLKMMPLLSAVAGLFFAWQFTNILNPSHSFWLKNNLNHEASCSMWYLAPLSTQNSIYYPYKLALLFQKNLDNGWTEISSAQGLFLSFSSSFYSTLPPQNSVINSMITMMFFFLPLTLFLYIF